MAKARMLHKQISISVQVSSLPLEGQLLFTWMISHADDDGRLKGNPKYIRATVVPLHEWTVEKVATLISQMDESRLINYWEENNEHFIEFPNWKKFQKIRKYRYTESELPSRTKKIYQRVTNVQPDDNQFETQSNIVKNSVNGSEANLNQIKISDNQAIAESSSKREPSFIDPTTFNPNSEVEFASLDAWKQLEPTNPLSFSTTYLWAVHKGLQAHLFYQFTSEIKQDPTARNKGAIFRLKAEKHFSGIGG